MDMPKAAQSPLFHAFCCFPGFRVGRGIKKTPRRASFNRLISWKKSGAGEGIRTLDPNLGKREIAMSPRSTVLRRNSPECATVRDFGRGRESHDHALEWTPMNDGALQWRQETVTAAGPLKT